MTLFGLFYLARPAAAQSKLAKAHFWIYVPATLHPEGGAVPVLS